MQAAIRSEDKNLAESSLTNIFTKHIAYFLTEDNV